MFVLQSNDDVLKIWGSINFLSVLRDGIEQVCTGCIPRGSENRHTECDLIGQWLISPQAPLHFVLEECKQVFSPFTSDLLSEDLYKTDLPLLTSACFLTEKSTKQGHWEEKHFDFRSDQVAVLYSKNIFFQYHVSLILIASVLSRKKKKSGSNSSLHLS